MSTMNTAVPSDHLVPGRLCTDQDLVIQQTKVESQALEHVTRALEITVEWVVQSDDYFRKLSSVRFLTESYQRHLERLFALEELDGYMGNVGLLHTELAAQVAVLKLEHEQFRAAVRKIVLRLDGASSTDYAKFEAICGELRNVFTQVLEHIRQENKLFVESVQQDTGGEG